MEESAKIENVTLLFWPKRNRGEIMCLGNGGVKTKIYWRVKIMWMRGGSNSPEVMTR